MARSLEMAPSPTRSEGILSLGTFGLPEGHRTHQPLWNWRASVREAHCDVFSKELGREPGQGARSGVPEGQVRCLVCSVGSSVFQGIVEDARYILNEGMVDVDRSL